MRNLATGSMSTIVALLVVSLLSIPAAVTAAKGGGGGGGGKPGGGGGTANPEVVYEKYNHPGKMLAMDIDGANKTTVLDYNVEDPAWSAGGTQYVYTSEHPARGIYKCNTDGTGEVFLAPTYTYVANAPQWSPVPTPDGQYKIAFTDRLEGKNRRHVWIMNTDGSGLQMLKPESQGTGSDYYPTWSPDANRLAVRHIRNGYPDTVIVYTLGAAAGDGLEVLLEDVLDFTGTALEGAEIWESAYARASERLVLTAREAGASSDDLWVVPISDPSASWRLTDTPGENERGPSWCGDDLYVVFYSTAQTRTIYRIDSNGANRTEIGNSKKAEDAPDCKF